MVTTENLAAITVVSTSSPTPPNPPVRRLAFLDAIRGIAAFAVMFQHGAEKIFPSFSIWGLQRFNFGIFGVVAFFLVSGFIIPVSIEKYASVLRFWKGRFWRLYPMYWCSLLLALLFGYLRLFPLNPRFYSSTISTVLANVTMFQDYLRIPNAIPLYWTLALEMAFYVICTFLYWRKWLERSMLWAVSSILAMAALEITVAALFHKSLPYGRIGLLVTCFVGTLTYRFHQNRVKVISALWLGLLLGPVLVAGFWLRYSLFPSVSERSDNFSFLCVVSSWVAAYSFFFLVFLFRHQSFPLVLQWLGRISYSLYLLHALVVWGLPGEHFAVLWLLMCMTISIGLSYGTYTWIERPLMSQG